MFRFIREIKTVGFLNWCWFVFYLKRDEHSHKLNIQFIWIIKMKNKIYIGITSGMRGTFPVMYDEDGPIQTGCTCKNYESAKKEAISWAKAEFGDDWKNHTPFDGE